MGLHMSMFIQVLLVKVNQSIHTVKYMSFENEFKRWFCFYINANLLFGVTLPNFKKMYMIY